MNMHIFYEYFGNRSIPVFGFPLLLSYNSIMLIICRRLQWVNCGKVSRKMANWLVTERGFLRKIDSPWSVVIIVSAMLPMTTTMHLFTLSLIILGCVSCTGNRHPILGLVHRQPAINNKLASKPNLTLNS